MATIAATTIQTRKQLEESILQDFYNNRIDLDAASYSSYDEYEKAMRFLFSVLCSWETAEIINLLTHSSSGTKTVSANDVPQFSSFFDAVYTTPKRLLESGQANVSYIDMGKLLFPNAQKEDGAHRKYGENHAKTAALLGLTTVVSYQINLTDFGKVFMSLDSFQQAKIIPALCLKVPILYNFYCCNGQNPASIENDMDSASLTESTKGRRRSNINAMRNVIDQGFYFELIPSSQRLKATRGPISNDRYHQYLTAIRTKPFILLAGISGTGKSRIVRKLAQSSVTQALQTEYDPNSVANGFNRWNLHKPANFELIQVKPNWHNSMDVVGYKSNIGGSHYEFTPFIKFVARAWLHQEIPFFLCLDEMNLAPVEQYFAEFLSAIESRSIENNNYMTDPIVKPFDSFNTINSNGISDGLSDKMVNELIGALDTPVKTDIANQFKTKGLTLPKNLIIMGTVNMDETTFSFSRKVLDRAMSIVMNEVNFDDFISGRTENDVPIMSNADIKRIIDRPIQGISAPNNQASDVKVFLDAINAKEMLGSTPFKLGYRAINEALLYVSAASEFGVSDTTLALDQFTMMKILSRIEGDKRSIGNLLNDLQEVIDESYTESYAKLKQMEKTLNESQFVSYWT